MYIYVYTRIYIYKYMYLLVCIRICRMYSNSSRYFLKTTRDLCNTLQHTATHCNTLQHTATHYNTLQHTATHCNIILHKRNVLWCDVWQCELFGFVYKDFFPIKRPGVWSSLLGILMERWGAGVETLKNVRGEIGGWGRVPFNEPYAPLFSSIYDGA